MSTENLSSRACPECGGEGWYEADIGRGGSNPAECAACNGTGRDKRGEPLIQLTQLIRRYLKRKGRGYVANGIIPPSVVEDAEKLIYLMNLTATNDKVGKVDLTRSRRTNEAWFATGDYKLCNKYVGDAKGNHVHTCPWCLHDIACDDTCSVEPDLTREDGTLRGSHVKCDACSGVGR